MEKELRDLKIENQELKYQLARFEYINENNEYLKTLKERDARNSRMQVCLAEYEVLIKDLNEKISESAKERQIFERKCAEFQMIILKIKEHIGADKFKEIMGVEK